jgi:hypothetical protein
MDEGKAQRLTREGTMHHLAPPADVFPLLCPVRERDWLEGWNCTIVHTASGVAEPGCVFTTTGAEGALNVWTVSRHDPEAGVVEFVVVAAGLYVMKLDIALEADGAGTRARWRRTFTALTPAGERAMTALDAAEHRRRLGHLEASINHYLRSGGMLRA